MLITRQKWLKILSENIRGIFLDFVLCNLLTNWLQTKLYCEKIDIFSWGFRLDTTIAALAAFQCPECSIWLFNVWGSLEPETVRANHASSRYSNPQTFQNKFNLYNPNNLHFTHQNGVCGDVTWCYKRLLFKKYLNLCFSERKCHSRLSNSSLPLNFHNEFKTQNIPSF